MFVIRLPNGNLQVPATAVHTGDGRIIGDVYVEIGPDDTDYARLSEQALTPDQLLDRAWSGDSYSPERVKVHVANLRRKLADAGAPPDRIETVRGFGYRYRRPK